MQYEEIIDIFWKEYVKTTPSAGKIHELLEAKGEKISNDHIAFRTFNHPSINVEQLAMSFLACGYVEKDEYTFEAKKLRAKHYEHPDANAPKIFISELLLEEFSEELQYIVLKKINEIPLGLIETDSTIYSGRPWGTISHETYLKLREESEYAAWMYVYGFCANHFTINVNQLTAIESLEEMNSFLKNNGFLMNVSGGEIKGSPDALLEQSSILADKKAIEFAEGSFEIPSCYYEFARRYEDVSGSLFNGFIAKSADKIFESTNAAS
ncbi:DUF1338 domain-containing protein [Reichenbachiella sp.]|uniref:DUF1338 domain-containing protein n=1 Tax=Reichenbachiella sp. TaxID=2184521 RepID=UPI003B58D60F